MNVLLLSRLSFLQKYPPPFKKQYRPYYRSVSLLARRHPSAQIQVAGHCPLLLVLVKYYVMLAGDIINIQSKMSSAREP
jgi:hypothetical protein